MSIASALWPWISSALLGAFIGWITNVMTIRLMFRPRRPVRMMGVTLQGIVPRRRNDIARSLAQTIAEQLLSARDVWDRIDTAENREALLTGVRGAVRSRLARLPAFPFRDALAVRIENTVVSELDAQLVQLAHDPDMPARIMARVPVADMIEEKIRSFDLDEFERILVGLSRRELRQIELLGGLLGFVVGLVLPLVEALHL
jgi:uncharacterized membrane protein YheB (UPF0754 family)